MKARVFQDIAARLALKVLERRLPHLSPSPLHVDQFVAQSVALQSPFLKEVSHIKV
jgi:hypothetical protein